MGDTTSPGTEHDGRPGLYVQEEHTRGEGWCFYVEAGSGATEAERWALDHYDGEAAFFGSPSKARPKAERALQAILDLATSHG